MSCVCALVLQCLTRFTQENLAFCSSSRFVAFHEVSMSILVESAVQLSLPTIYSVYSFYLIQQPVIFTRATSFSFIFLLWKWRLDANRPFSVIMMSSCPVIVFHRRLCIGSYLASLTSYTSYLCRLVICGLLSSAGRIQNLPFLVITSTPPSHRTSPHYIGSPRCEVYVRLPFVDDLRLRGAMQGFLTGESSHKAEFNK